MTTAATTEPTVADPAAPHHHDRRLSRAMVVLLIGYVALILVLMVARGAYMSPEVGAGIVFAVVAHAALQSGILARTAGRLAALTDRRAAGN